MSFWRVRTEHRTSDVSRDVYKLRLSNAEGFAFRLARPVTVTRTLPNDHLNLFVLYPPRYVRIYISIARVAVFRVCELTTGSRTNHYGRDAI